MCYICDEENPSHPRDYCFHRYEHPRIKKSHFKKSREKHPFFRTLREDFKYRCCYCTLHENEVGGWPFFETDHFIPRNLNDALETVYTNLFYSCRFCNSYKRADPKVMAGWYVNPCEGNLHTRHLVETDDGCFEGQTDQGKYMAKHLRLGGGHVLRYRQRRLIKRRVEQEKLNAKISKWRSQLEMTEASLSRRLTSQERWRLEQVKTRLEQRIASTPERWLDMLQPSPFP